MTNKEELYDKPLLKGTQLYLHHLNKHTDYFKIMYEKLDDELFGWWSFGFSDPNKPLESQRYCRMDSHFVYKHYTTFLYLLQPKNYHLGMKVSHLETKNEGEINNFRFYAGEPCLGIFWYQGQKNCPYYWNRVDKLETL